MFTRQSSTSPASGATREGERAFGLLLRSTAEDHRFSNLPAELGPTRIRSARNGDPVVAVDDDERAGFVGLDDVDVMPGHAFVRPVDHQPLGARTSYPEWPRLTRKIDASPSGRHLHGDTQAARWPPRGGDRRHWRSRYGSPRSTSAFDSRPQRQSRILPRVAICRHRQDDARARFDLEHRRSGCAARMRGTALGCTSARFDAYAISRPAVGDPPRVLVQPELA